MNILDMALSLEYDLEKYYKEQADLYKGSGLDIIFSLLAREESNHVSLLRSKADNLSYNLVESSILTESKSLFKNLDDFHSDIVALPTQLDSYRFALDKEEESYKFYKNAATESTDYSLKEIFQYLIKQENNHCLVLEEIIKLLTRAEEWVESAEFGIREEY